MYLGLVGLPVHVRKMTVSNFGSQLKADFMSVQSKYMPSVIANVPGYYAA
jgi:hypothetical protein